MHSSFYSSLLLAGNLACINENLTMDRKSPKQYQYIYIYKKNILGLNLW